MKRLFGKTYLTYIDMVKKKICHDLHSSLTIGELRTILENDNEIPPNAHFIHNENYTIATTAEKTITLGRLLNKDNVVQLKIDENKSISNDDIQPVSKSDSIIVYSQNKIITSNDLNSKTWEQVFKISNLLYGIQMFRKSPEYAKKPILKFQNSNDKNFPSFKVEDGSYIKAYMTNNQIKSSFVSNRFFDVGAEFSDLPIDFKLKYSRIKLKTIDNRTKYLTCCFSFPRVKIEYDGSYLEPTIDFIQSIDEIILTKNFNEQINKLEKLFSIYGYVYPFTVTLGAHLYYTEQYFIHNQIEEQEQIKKAETKFFLWKINTNQENKKISSEQNSSICFQAVGGDTLTTHDFTTWIRTIAYPDTWRVIEHDDCRSIISILDQSRQDKLKNIIHEYHQQKIFQRLYSKWKQDAITVLGQNQLGSLSRYSGIRMDDDQTIYIADCDNHWIVEWKLNEKTSRIIAGKFGRGYQTNQFDNPIDITIDKNNNSFIIADYGNRRVMKWSRQNHTTDGQIIIKSISCSGLTIDKDGTLYVSDGNNHHVKRWKKNEIDGTIVAGGNYQGNQLNQLNTPTYIYVDEYYSLYVTDQDNHRVIKWTKDAKVGIVVAGGNGQGNDWTQLSNPRGITVDPLGNIYIADFDNHRVMRWNKGEAQGQIIVGENGKGEQLNQLNNPSELFFDSQANLYVVDVGNHRIQKYEVDLN